MPAEGVVEPSPADLRARTVSVGVGAAPRAAAAWRGCRGDGAVAVEDVTAPRWPRPGRAEAGLADWSSDAAGTTEASESGPAAAATPAHCGPVSDIPSANAAAPIFDTRLSTIPSLPCRMP